MASVDRPGWRRALSWVSLASLALLLVRYLLHNPEWFGVEFAFVAEVLLVTALTRSVSTWGAAQAFARGIWISMPLVLVIGQGLLGRALAFPLDTPTMKGAVVPALEEAVKIFPVAVAGWLAARRGRPGFNPSDWLALGVMSGAGFDIVEKLFYQNNFQFTYGPHLGRFFVFPDALGVAFHEGWTGFIGHAAATGFVGLGVGAGLILRRAPRLGARAWWWAAPLAAYAWVTWEHAMWNLRLESRWAVGLTPATLTPWLFLILAAAVISHDALAVRRTLAASAMLRRWLGFVWNVFRAARTQTGAVSRPRAAAGWFRVLRMANAAAWLPGAPAPTLGGRP